MINYPKNYAPLAEEEMEYTSGGLSINWMALGSTVMGLATSMQSLPWKAGWWISQL